jgi:hypothetical protein
MLIYCDGYRNRGIGISDSSNGAKEGPYFEPHAVVSAKRFKSVNGHALACLKCASSDQLPVAVSAVMVVCNVSLLSKYLHSLWNY